MDKMTAKTPQGLDLLLEPLWNMGTAFSLEARKEYGLLGLLPPHIESLEEQTARAYEALGAKDTDLERHIYLRALQDTNEVLFYSLVISHIREMMPLIYTPVVGEACEKYSEIYRHPRGLFIAYPHRDHIGDILDNAPNEDEVAAIVVTDGERILGLGDQGAGGMGIPIGKLSLYTAAGGVDPHKTLPIILDAGTNNKERLADPLYIGWRHERITGDDYFDFVDKFVSAVKEKWPTVLLQFEDFAQPHAEPLLMRYRDQLCCFNDDIQGTAAVTTGTLLAACKVTGVPLRDQKIAFLGAGSAGAGIAEQIIRVMRDEGLAEEEARARIFMVDRYGLLHDEMDGLMDFQKRLAHKKTDIAAWSRASDGTVSLNDVIREAAPGILIGVSGQHGLFTEEIIRGMTDCADRPIVFPLSNPTSRAEAEPKDILNWSNGTALIATGSPFDPVTFRGEVHEIAQSNNTYIFPGVGLGILASGARRVNDAMFMAAARALAEMSPALENHRKSLLPAIDDIREVSRTIALAVARQAVSENLAPPADDAALEKKIDTNFWSPAYRNLLGTRR